MKKSGDHSRKVTAPRGRSAPERYILRLYVAGLTPRSSAAIRNIRVFCDAHLKTRYDLEIVDICAHPDRARDAQIIAAPTLIKQLPLPLRRLIGDMSDEGRVLIGLDLTNPAT